MNKESIKFYIEKYGSDKNISGYTHYYEKVFSPIRDTVRNLLEIGIGTQEAHHPSSFIGNKGLFSHYTPGGSLRAWRDFFHNAQIYGVDVAEDCRLKENRLETFIFSSLDTVNCNQHFLDESLDIIIDDGLHTGIGQLYTMYNFFRKVKRDGWYIIEDCGGGGDGTNIFIDFEKNFRQIADDHEYFFGGNFIIINKSFSGKGKVDNFEDFVENMYTAPKIEVTENLTVVSGLWDLKRINRDFDHYIENFKKFLDIPVKMYLYLPEELHYIVWENPNRTKNNTIIRQFELDDIKNNYYKPFWENTQNIRNSDDWRNITGIGGWLQNSPQARNVWYNPVVQSKMFMLHDAKIINSFNTDYFIWLDAGITNTVSSHYFTEDRCLDKILPHLDKFLFLSYPYDAVNEIHGFDYSKMNEMSGQPVKYVCRGGLFGGHKDCISQANSDYYSLLDNTLAQGYMGTEESIFTILAHKDPYMYKRFMLKSHGMIANFMEALVSNSVKLETTNLTKTQKANINYNINNFKTNLYVLTFNFPKQFAELAKSLSKYPEWINTPRKILINNSNNPAVMPEYENLCKEYGFEHIITGENLGINRGRMYAAKHFDESDADFYIFFEDDMLLHTPEMVSVCRNGFRNYVPDLYNSIHNIMLKEEFDFLKLSFTEVYMDNNIQVSWYNVPQHIRTSVWPEYDKLPISGLDPNAPKTKFNKIGNYNGLSYISGEIYYANWPMIVSREGNKKMFINIQWENPFEQTWMSYMFQETLKQNINPAVLLASPINHNRILHYKPEERREN